jgi:thiopurine S-methyltransferase
MEPNFWLERWQKHEIGFHQASVQPALQKFWPRLAVAKGATVFVPLCGKTLDMAWLADGGYRVVGAELSELAIDEFFAERGVTPDVKTVDAFKVKTEGAIELWCGDFFALDPAQLPVLDALYDRAAFVAMPPAMQPAYAKKLGELLPASAPGLLLGLDYNTAEMSGPPFAIPQAHVHELLSADFDIELLDARDGIAKSEHLAKRGLTRLEEASYLLKRRA